MKKRISRTIILAVPLVMVSLASGQGQATDTSPSMGIYNSAMIKPPVSKVPMTPEAFRVEIVKRIIARGSPIIDGKVQLHRMGDEAAVNVLRIFGTRAQISDAERGTVLELVQAAYEHPDSIVNPADREPRAALFLLQYIATSTNDQVVRGRATQIKESLIGAAKGSGTAK